MLTFVQFHKNHMNGCSYSSLDESLSVRVLTAILPFE